jgi:hypothetical protein
MEKVPEASRGQQKLSGSLAIQRKEGNSNLGEKFATLSAAIQHGHHCEQLDQTSEGV